MANALGSELTGGCTWGDAAFDSDATDDDGCGTYAAAQSGNIDYRQASEQFLSDPREFGLSLGEDFVEGCFDATEGLTSKSPALLFYSEMFKYGLQGKTDLTEWKEALDGFLEVYNKYVDTSGLQMDGCDMYRVADDTSRFFGAKLRQAKGRVRAAKKELTAVNRHKVRRLVAAERVSDTTTKKVKTPAQVARAKRRNAKKRAKAKEKKARAKAQERVAEAQVQAGRAQRIQVRATARAATREEASNAERTKRERKVQAEANRVSNQSMRQARLERDRVKSLSLLESIAYWQSKQVFVDKLASANFELGLAGTFTHRMETILAAKNAREEISHRLNAEIIRISDQVMLYRKGLEVDANCWIKGVQTQVIDAAQAKKLALEQRASPLQASLCISGITEVELDVIGRGRKAAETRLNKAVCEYELKLLRTLRDDLKGVNPSFVKTFRDHKAFRVLSSKGLHV